MFWFSKKKKVEDEIFKQLEDLWFCHNSLAELVRNITEIIKKMTEGMQINRADFEHLAHQTMKIAETQSKILSHLSDKQTEEYLSKDFSTTVH